MVAGPSCKGYLGDDGRFIDALHALTRGATVKLLPIIAAALVLAMSPPLAGQAVFPEWNGSTLTGVLEFDARMAVSTWLEIPEDRDRFQQNAQSAFELALRRDGVIVDEGAPNYLVCSISAAGNGGIRFYGYSVEYYAFESSSVHRLLWKYGGVVTIGSSKFTSEEAAQDCADPFINEWLKWNPRR